MLDTAIVFPKRSSSSFHTILTRACPCSWWYVPSHFATSLSDTNSDLCMSTNLICLVWQLVPRVSRIISDIIRESLPSRKVFILWWFRDAAFTLVHGTSSMRVAAYFCFDAGGQRWRACLMQLPWLKCRRMRSGCKWGWQKRRWSSLEWQVAANCFSFKLGGTQRAWQGRANDLSIQHCAKSTSWFLHLKTGSSS